MRRSIGTIAAVAALALAATACGSDEGDSGGDDGADGELTGTVTFWDTSNETEAEVFRAVAEDFETQNPGVTVDYVNVGFGDAQNRFKNAAAANEAPDVMRTEVAWVADFASLSTMAPASAARSASSTQRQIRPHCAACSASSLSPNSASPIARAVPTSRGRKYVAPASGNRPSLPKACMK